MKKTNLLKSWLILGVSAAVLGGCAGVAKVTPPAPQGTAVQPNAVQEGVKETKASEPIILAGKVIETMNTVGYTYLYLEKDGKKGWIAVPSTTVTVGQEVQVRPGVEMGLFVSKTLNRTFENIVFSPGLVTDAHTKVEGQPANEKNLQLPPGHPGGDKHAKVKDASAMIGLGSGETTGNLSGKVVETMKSGGYSYICIEKEGQKVWSAVPATDVKVGDQVEVLPGNVMPNFTSKSLNRTFESITFSSGIVSKR